MLNCLYAAGAKTNCDKIKEEPSSQTPRKLLHFLLETDSTAAAGRGNEPRVQSSQKMEAKSGDLCEFASGQTRSGRCNPLHEDATESARGDSDRSS
jgi:hypothetical protein